MAAIPLRREERDPGKINEAISQLQQGRSNAHGTFALDDDGAATTTTVVALTCSSASHVNITPTNAAAANMIRGADVFVTPGNGSFVVTHGATSSTLNFSYSING